MKKLLLAGILSVGSVGAARGQALDLSPLPIDSTTQRISISQIVEVPGATKNELYSRAREWFASSFTSSKAVLEMDDRDAGKLIGRYNAPLKLASGVGVSLDMLMWRTIRVEMKDGKYRYTFTSFALGAPTMPETSARPAEQYLKPGGMTYQKDGTPKKMAASVIGGIRGESNQMATSLREAMTKPAGKDW